MSSLAACAVSACLLLAPGCDSTPVTDAGTDSGPPTDSGPVRLCPTSNAPAPEELNDPCCWRSSNADQLDTPELRLTYVEITSPEGNLASPTFRRVLNEATQLETFNWLVRTTGADADGDITIVTGFGRRTESGTYEFSQGAASSDPANWCPVTIPATLSGEMITSDPIAGDITVPVFDETGDELQVELTLRQIAIDNATWTENRTCIGAKIPGPFNYEPAATLTGFIEVGPSRTQVIDVPPINSTVCAVVAGSLTDATYCDSTDQADWDVQPNALCDVDGCEINPDGGTTICDPSTTCNAWAFVADFAAAGVDITNDACP